MSAGTGYSELVGDLRGAEAPTHTIGYLSPLALMDVVPYVFYRSVPPGVMLVMQDLGLRSYESGAVWAAFQQTDDLVRLFAAKQLDLLVLGGSILSLSLDPHTLRGRLARMSEVVNAPVVTDLEITVAAMLEEGVGRVVVAHRLSGLGDAAIVEHLDRVGLEAVGVVSAPATPKDNLSGGYLDGIEAAHELGRRAFLSHPEADALLLLGGSWLAQGPAAELAAEFGRPVFNNLSALVWSAFRLIDGRGLDAGNMRS